MTDLNSLPGCFALHKPTPPNNCPSCPVKPLCKKVILKTELTALLERMAKVEEAERRIEAVLRGG